MGTEKRVSIPAIKRASANDGRELMLREQSRKARASR